jgi:hypothetical protein
MRLPSCHDINCGGVDYEGLAWDSSSMGRPVTVGILDSLKLEMLFGQSDKRYSVWAKRSLPLGYVRRVVTLSDASHLKNDTTTTSIYLLGQRRRQ